MYGLLEGKGNHRNYLSAKTTKEVRIIIGEETMGEIIERRVLKWFVYTQRIPEDIYKEYQKTRNKKRFPME